LVDCETGSVVNEEEDLAESDGSIAESGDTDEEKEMSLILVINMMIVMLMEPVLVQIHMYVLQDMINYIA
jgi:hypothetical protein